MMWSKGWVFGVLPVLGVLGCGQTKEEQTASLAERGAVADARLASCEGFGLRPFSVDESLAALATTHPDDYRPALDCILAATDCEAVLACTEQDFESSLSDVPCQGDPLTAGRCRGNTAVRCGTNDDIEFWEISFDCSLVGGTCYETSDDGGRTGANCALDASACEADGSHCDGDRAILCREDAGQALAAEYDCSAVFGAACEMPAGSELPRCSGDALPTD